MSTPNAKGNGLKVINRLTVKQIFELCRYLEDLQPTFDTSTNFSQLAVKASDHFKFSITEYNIKGAFETAELKLPEPPKSDKQKIAILKAAVESLHTLLGVELPPNWSDL